MSTVIKLKKSETALSKPTTSDLAVGEVAINALDQRIFVRDSSDNIVTIGEAGGLRFESSTVTYEVTVATKDSSHRYDNSGSGSGYKIDGTFSPVLQLVPGNTYRFDQSDSTNSGHPLRFYYKADKTTAYTSGVTTNGTPGSTGAYTEIVVGDSTPSVLHYQCSAHSYMGNQVFTFARNLTGFDTDDVSEGSSNQYYTDTRANSAFDTRLATKDTDDLSEGSSNLYYTNARVDTEVDAHLNVSGASANQYLQWSGSDYQWATVTSGGGGISLTDLSVGAEGTASGDGAIAYNDSTGVFTYTPPDLSTYLTTVAFSDLTGKPTTISGYGITDAFDGDYDNLTNKPTIPSDLTDLGISDGTSGQVLKTDGNGNFTFGDVSSGGGAGSAFTSIAVSGQTTVTSDSATDTLTFVAEGLNTITTNATTDTVTFGTPTGIPFTKEDGTSTSLNLSVEAGTLSTAVQNLYIPFTKDDGSSVTTLVMSS
jgi:hypothetical protein